MKTKLLLTAFLISIFSSVFAGDGKIAFSKSPIDAASFGGITSTPSFEFGEKIYCFVHLPKPVGKFKSSEGLDHAIQWSAIVHIDDAKDKTFQVNAKRYGLDEALTVQDFGFQLDTDHDKFKMALNDLKPGSHIITVEIWVGKKILSAEIPINKSNDAKLKYGKTLKSVEAGMQNPSLEAKALSAIKDYLKKMSNLGYTLIQEKVVITSKDWQIIHDKYTGAILSRRFYVVVAIKNKNGECKLESVGLSQSYAGSTGYNEQFTEVKFYFKGDMISNGDIWEEPCDCE